MKNKNNIIGRFNVFLFLLLFYMSKVYAYSSSGEYQQSFRKLISLLKTITKFTMETLIVVFLLYIIYTSIFEVAKRGYYRAKTERESMILQVGINPVITGFIGLLILTFVLSELNKLGIPVYDIIRDWLSPQIGR